MYSGLQTMEFSDQFVEFNVHGINPICSLNVIDFLVQDCFELDNEDVLEVATDAPHKKLQGTIAQMEALLRVCKQGEVLSILLSVADKEYSVMEAHILEWKPHPCAIKGFCEKMNERRELDKLEMFEKKNKMQSENRKHLLNPGALSQANNIKQWRCLGNN